MIEGIIGLVTALAGVTGQLLAKMPNYPQKKKEHYFYLLSQFNLEIKMERYARDDNKIMFLKEEILNFVNTFTAEIQAEEKKKGNP